MSNIKDLEHDDLVYLCEKVARAHSQVHVQLKQVAQPKKMQFSKKICIAGLVFVVLMLCCNVMLALMDKQLLSDVTNTVVTVFGGFATGGYFALSGVRDCSKNRHHVEIKEENSNEQTNGIY